MWPTLQAGKEFRRNEGLATVQVRVWSVASLKMWDSTGIKGWKGWACERRGTFHLKGYEERHIVEWKQQQQQWLLLNKVSFNTYSAEHMFCPYRGPRLLRSRNFHLARIRKAHDDRSSPAIVSKHSPSLDALFSFQIFLALIAFRYHSVPIPYN